MVLTTDANIAFLREIFFKTSIMHLFSIAEASSESSRTSKMKLNTNIVRGFKMLAVFAARWSDVQPGSAFAFDTDTNRLYR